MFWGNSIFVGKPDGNWHRWKNNIKLDLWVIVLESVNWIYIIQE
jgi:hypothetical protein